MPDRFPLRPDAVWFDAMVGRYGDVVPDIESLQIRRGIQVHDDDFFVRLHGLDLQAVTIHSIVTRNAGFVIVDARGHVGLPDGDYGAVDPLLEHTRGRLSEACEHCGRAGEIIAKTGMEALLDDPDAVLGDRFLCVECYEDWSHHDD